MQLCKRYFSNYTNALDFLDTLRGKIVTLGPVSDADPEARGALYVVSWWSALS